MKRSVREAGLLTLDTVDCIIDGLRVKRVGEYDLRDRPATTWTIS